MEELKTAHVSSEPIREVKTDSNISTNSHGSRNFNHQRVSVRDIIESHYRKGK